MGEMTASITTVFISFFSSLKLILHIQFVYCFSILHFPSVYWSCVFISACSTAAFLPGTVPSFSQIAALHFPPQIGPAFSGSWVTTKQSTTATSMAVVLLRSPARSDSRRRPCDRRRRRRMSARCIARTRSALRTVRRTHGTTFIATPNNQKLIVRVMSVTNTFESNQLGYFTYYRVEPVPELVCSPASLLRSFNIT